MKLIKTKTTHRTYKYNSDVASIMKIPDLISGKGVIPYNKVNKESMIII